MNEMREKYSELNGLLSIKQNLKCFRHFNRCFGYLIVM